MAESIGAPRSYSINYFEDYQEFDSLTLTIKDPAAKWDTIVKMSKFLQQKVASPAMEPTTRGEFGYRGQYDYSTETADLPQATEFLKAASNAAFKSFTPDEQKKSLEIMDGILRETKPLSLQENLNPLKEEQRYLPPSHSDLMDIRHQ